MSQRFTVVDCLDDLEKSELRHDKDMYVVLLSWMPQITWFKAIIWTRTTRRFDHVSLYVLVASYQNVLLDQVLPARRSLIPPKLIRVQLSKFPKKNWFLEVVVTKR